MTDNIKGPSFLKQLHDAGLTWRVLLFSFPFLIAWTFIFFIGTYGGLITYTNPPLLLMLLAEAAIMKVFGKKFGLTIQEWTVFITIAMSGMMSSSVLYDRNSFAWGGMAESWVSKFMQIFYQFQYIAMGGSGVKYPLPATWFPTDPALNTSLMAGKIDVPWLTWLPYILFWIAVMIPFWLAFHFISTLLRKGFIEEKLTFPMAAANITLLQMAKEHNRPSLFSLKSRSGKAFWIAFLVGGMWPCYCYGANLLNGVRNNFMNGVPIRWATSFYSGINLGPYLNTIIPGYSWGWGAQTYITYFPFYYFMSMDVLLSIVLCVALFSFIFPGIMMATGTGVVGQLRLYGTSGPVAWTVMFQGAFGSGYGGLVFGLSAWLFWHYRKHIMHTIKSAIAGEKREASEPYSWRFVWIALVLCIVVCYGVFLSGGMNPLFLLNLLLIWFIFWPSITRGTADLVGNLLIPGGGVYLGAEGRDIWKIFGYDVTNKSDPNLVGSSVWMLASTGALELQTTGHAQATMTAYKIADDTGTNASSVGWAYIIAIIVGFIFAIPAAIWTMYNWGSATLFARVVELGGQRTELGSLPLTYIGTDITKMVVYGSAVSNPNYHYWVLLGAIVTFVLFQLRATFSWFFFNPIALASPDAGLTGGLGTFGCVIIMIVAKWLTFKLGGAKAYDEIGVPAVAAYVAAIAVWQTVWLLATMGMY